jgi:formate dehydrogenase subunit gamma
MHVFYAMSDIRHSKYPQASLLVSGSIHNYHGGTTPNNGFVVGMSDSKNAVKTLVDAVVQANRDAEGALMPVLHGIQAKVGYIPMTAVPLIAERLGFSRAEVHGVITFYHDFRTRPRGKTTIQVCRAEACQAMGSRELEAHVKNRLGIDYGETTEDGQYSLEPVYCLGNCACTPSIRIGDDVHARVDAGRFDEILADIEAGTA